MVEEVTKEDYEECECALGVIIQELDETTPF